MKNYPRHFFYSIFINHYLLFVVFIYLRYYNQNYLGDKRNYSQYIIFKYLSLPHYYHLHYIRFEMYQFFVILIHAMKIKYRKIIILHSLCDQISDWNRHYLHYIHYYLEFMQYSEFKNKALHYISGIFIKFQWANYFFMIILIFPFLIQIVIRIISYIFAHFIP